MNCFSLLKQYAPQNFDKTSSSLIIYRRHIVPLDWATGVINGNFETQWILIFESPKNPQVSGTLLKREENKTKCQHCHQHIPFHIDYVSQAISHCRRRIKENHLRVNELEHYKKTYSSFVNVRTQSISERSQRLTNESALPTAKYLPEP